MELKSQLIAAIITLINGHSSIGFSHMWRSNSVLEPECWLRHWRSNWVLEQTFKRVVCQNLTTIQSHVRLCCCHVFVNWQRETEKSDHSNSMWHQYDSRNMDVIPPGTAQSVPFLCSNPLIKLWNRFGLHHDSMQSGTEQGSIISWHAGVRGCISLRAGAVLCQETSRFASTCRPGLHGSPEGNLIQSLKHWG